MVRKLENIVKIEISVPRGKQYYSLWYRDQIWDWYCDLKPFCAGRELIANANAISITLNTCQSLASRMLLALSKVHFILKE